MASLNAFKAIQMAISTLGSIRLKVDGDFGKKSMNAFMSLPVAGRSFIEDMAKLFNVSLPRVISTADAERIARSVAARENVPFSYLWSTLKHESPPIHGGFKIEMEGKYRGLGQFGDKAWRDVGLKDWAINVGKPEQDFLAMALFYKKNRAYYISHWGSSRGFTDTIAYLYHNQGAGGARQLLKGKPKSYFYTQSAAAIKLFRPLVGKYNESGKNWSIA